MSVTGQGKLVESVSVADTVGIWYTELVELARLANLMTTIRILHHFSVVHNPVAWTIAYQHSVQGRLTWFIIWKLTEGVLPITNVRLVVA